MWNIHKLSGEQGWHICQKYIHQSAKLLVFVKEGESSWKLKLWNRDECYIRAKTHDEHVQDDRILTNSGFIFHNPSTITP